MPVQPVSDIARLLGTPFVDPKTGLITYSWREYLRYNVHAKVFGSMDLQGIVKAGAADFARPYVNKQLDNIPDGTTYARPRSGTLVSGVIPVAFGKNLCPNAGFEANVIGVPVNSNVSLNAPVCDSWFFQSDGGSGTFSSQLSTTKSHSGNQSGLIRLNSGIVFPASTGRSGNIFSTAHLPLAIGDILRTAGWYTFDSVGLPSWLTIQVVVGLAVFNQAGTFLQTIAAANATGITASFLFIQAAITIPSLVAGQVPAFAVPFVQVNANNTSGSSQTTTASLADVRFDDVRTIVQNTAFDVTPINTAGTPTTTTGLCQQSGTTTTINIASSTWQFGDGQISYNSGSVNPGAFGLYYIYADDPTFSGGAVTYQATLTPSVCNAVNGRLVFGSLQTTGAGNVISTGGGSGGGGPRGKAFLS